MYDQETHRMQVFINYIYIYLRSTQSTQILQKRDEYKVM